MKRGLVTAIWAISVLGLSAVGGTAGATYPGHNGTIVFAADTDRGSQLFTVRANGKDLRQITHVKGDAMKPDWSPDGRRIVFEFDRPDGTCSIESVNRDGSGLVDLSGHRNDCENDPSFTPDGRSVVFVHSTFAFESIWHMDLHGRDRDLIAPAPAGLHAEDPNVSPDGTQLSFITEKEAGTHALFVVNMDGSDRRKVVPFRFDISTKSDWAPDGERIIFSENANEPQNPGNIATIRPDGTGLRDVTHYASSDVHATVGSYSPDGRQLVVRIQDRNQIGLYRICTCGGGPVPILAPTTLLPRGNDWGAGPGPARARASARNERIVFGRWNQALDDTVIYTMNATVGGVVDRTAAPVGLPQVATRVPWGDQRGHSAAPWDSFFTSVPSAWGPLPKPRGRVPGLDTPNDLRCAACRESDTRDVASLTVGPCSESDDVATGPQDEKGLTDDCVPAPHPRGAHGARPLGQRPLVRDALRRRPRAR